MHPLIIQDVPPADKVFGTILTIEAGREDEVRAYLDDRETDAYGYELMPIDLWYLDGRKVDPPVPSYIFPGPRASGWVGPRPIDEVASMILSGGRPLRGLSYALRAADRLNRLGDERDAYLDALAEALDTLTCHVDG